MHFLLVVAIVLLTVFIFLAGFYFGAILIRKIDKKLYADLQKDLEDWTFTLREDNSNNFILLADEFRMNIIKDLYEAQAELQENRLFEIDSDIEENEDDNDDDDNPGGEQFH